MKNNLEEIHILVRSSLGSTLQKQKMVFVLQCSHLFVPLSCRSKVLTFEKTQINLFFYSLNRTFAAQNKRHG